MSEQVMNGNVKHHKWFYSLFICCGLLFWTNLDAARALYLGGRYNHSSGFYHSGNHHYPSGYYHGHGGGQMYYNADGDGYFKSGFHHDDDYKNGYHHHNVYFHNHEYQGSGSPLIINNGPYVPASSSACRLVNLCDSNNYCTQHRVCQ